MSAIRSSYVFQPTDTPNIVAGVDALNRLPSLCEDSGISRAVVITSPSIIQEERVLGRITSLLGGRGAGVFGDVRPHSPIEVVRRALDYAREHRADAVVSVGGGSSVDTAKGVVWYDDEKAERPRLKHIAIPSTVSGAEYSNDAGITVDGLKRVHRHTRIVPHVVVLDPTVAATTPLPLFRGSVLNALAHCLEGLVSIEASPMSDAFFLHAIRLLYAAAPHLEDTSGRSQAQGGAALAALYHVPMGLSHALVHVVGGRYRTPHGLTHAIMAPAVMRYNLPVVAEQQVAIARAFGREPNPGNVAAGAWSACTAAREFASSLGAPAGLRDLGVPRDGLDQLSLDVLTDPGVPTNPRPVNGATDAREVLEWAWSGAIPAP